MGRAKNKKPNASTTPTAVQTPQQQSTNLIAVAEPPPTVSSVSPARRSNGSRSPSTVNDTNEILSALRPYEQLLPALRGVGMAKQRLLHQSLYAAGCTAAQALETYLKDKTLMMSRNESTESTATSGGQSSESEELRLLLNYVSVEMAAENLRKVCSGPDGKILLRDAENKILNEVAAAALAAFAAAASRRPSTKQVEYMMNPTASVDMPEDTNSQSSQLTGVVAAMGEHERLESKQFQNPNALNPADPTSGVIPPTNVPIPAEHDDRLPWPSALTQSTGTNTMPGIPISISGKSSRKRAAPNSISRRRDRSDGTGELTDDGHLDLLNNDELESEEDYSDAELDEESEPISADQLDVSRHSDSPLEDFDYTDALLRFACTVGHVDIVKSLVKIRGSADYQSTHTSSMLMEACCAGQEEVTRELIASGANVNAVSATMNTPLIYAATAGKLEIHVDMRNQSGHTALMEASSAGNLEIVELLLARGADIFAIVENVDFKPGDFFQESSLSLASYRGHVDVVRSLLSQMPECAERVEELHAGLLEAAMDGHVEVARVLLDNGAPVNLPTENFESPLTLAACGGHYDLVNLLVERGADLEEPNDEGYTPLMEAAREGHRDVVELLLDHGANVNSKIEEGIETPLTLAASGGYLNIVEMLVSHGGDLTIGERTPLFEATQEGHIEVVKFIFVRDDISCSLVSAAETNNMELVDYFLEKNADINYFSKEGRTPLMEAAKQGHLTVIESLVNRGADVNIISPTNDATALSLACLFGRADVTQYLLEHGANPEVSLKDSVSCIIEASRNGNTDCARIVLDYIGVKGKEAAAQAAVGKKKPTNGTINDVSTAKAAEISQRPKIKPVSKLHSQQREPVTQTIGTISVQHVASKAPGQQQQFIDAVQQHQQQLCSCSDNSHQQQTPDLSTFLTQKVSPEWAAAASGIKGPILPNGGPSNSAQKTAASTVRTTEQQKRAPQSATVTTTTKQRHPAGSSGTTTTTTTATITATPVDPQNAAEILQQFPNDLMSSMMNAAANASMANSNQTNAAAVDEQMLAHFIQRSLVEPKRRDAAWTDQELGVFKDLVRQKMRALNPSAMNSSNVAASVQQQQITDLIEEHQEFMVANMLSGANLVGLDAECPGCAHSHAANFASSVHSKLGNVPPPNILPAAGGPLAHVQTASNNTTRSNIRTVDDEMDRLARAASETQIQPSMKRKGSAIKTRATLSMQAECVGYGSRQVSGMLKQKLAETSELLRSKLDAISMDVTSKSTTPGQSATSGGASLEDAMQKFRELSATTAAQQQQVQQQHTQLQLTQQQQVVPHQLQSSFPMVPNTTGTIQSPVYYNRTMTGTATSTALTAEQQQQIIFYQQQEFHNLQNLQTAAGHHHITSTTGAIQSATPCHPGSHHPTAAQMNNLSQQMHSTAKLARRTGQPIGKHAPNCSGHIRANMSSQTTITGSGTITTDVHQVPAEVSSYVDMQTDANNDTALTVACVGGHASLVSLLIQRGASVEHRDKKGFTPLILAATGGHVECCKLLIEANCQIDAQSERTKDTALSLACSGGRKEVVELLLRYGANKEHRNVSDYTPLSLAASGGYVDIIYLLLDAGAEINSRTGSKLGISPLMLAAMNGHDAATLVLLERGSDINAQIETNRNTALTLACFQGRTEVVRLLLSFGANVEHRAKTGLTPLMEAANGGYTDVGALLLKHGADPNAPPVPTSRDTALTIAADKGHATFVSMLLNQGATIDVKNKKGCTPLFLACSNGHLETVKILVKRRADVDALDNRKTSPLVAAFRKGFVKVNEMTRIIHVLSFKVVEFMVAHVNQFPNDLECHRYYNNLTDHDLANKVNLCLNVIVDAKAKQAEQANRAAESLLEQLAEELAKRAAEVEIDEDENLAVEEEEPEKVVPAEVTKMSKEPEKPLTVVQSEPAVEAQQPQLSKSQLKKMKQAAARAATQNVVSKENTPEEQPVIAVEIEDPRVPQTINDVPTETNGPTKLSSSTAPTNGKESRRQNRGRRNENGATGQPTATTTASRISIQPNATVMSSPQHSPNMGAKTGFTGAASAGNNSAEESEWLSAGKRRASSRPGKESNASRETVTNLSASSTAKDPLRDLVTLMEDNQNVSDAWSMTEPNSKRRAFAITVTSSTVARIIGRAGQNINAIREATNAHIEVEKIATRREQATRQITVKGAPDSIRNAVTMIDLLIRDNESHVSDIIRRVVRTDSLNSPATVAGAPVILPPIVALEKTAAITATSSTSTTSQATTPKQPSTTPTPPSSQTSFSASSVRPVSSNAQPAMTTQQPANVSGSATNVWQQRAAIRKMQQTNETTTSATSGSTATTPANQPTQQQSLSASTSESGSPAPQNSYVPQNFNHQPQIGSQVAGMPLPMAVEMGSVQTSDPNAISPQDFALQLEELKRKAPGFERPHQQTSVKSTAGGQSATTESRVDEISAMLSGSANENSLGYSFGNDGNKFMAGLLDMPPNSNATNSHVASMALSGEDRRSTQRPLSEIWATPPTTTNSGIGEDTNLSGFSGLFGSDPKSAASLWLPPSDLSGGTKSVKDDTWLDSSSALFSSLGLNDMNNANTMPTNVAPIGTKSNFGAQSIVSSTSSGRPHSSTDWTAAGSPWSSGSMFGTSSQQQQLGTSHWSAGMVNNVQQINNTPGVISPPKTSSMITSTQRPLLSNSTIARPSAIGTQSNASSSTGASNSASASSRMPPNWHAVFNQMAQQLGDVAEKEKQQKAAAAQAAQANVYAPYATAAMDDRLQFNGLMHASGGIPINSTEPQPQSASHSSVIKSYLDSMPKDFDLNLALSNSANEQLRQSFYNHMASSGNGLRGQSNTPMPRVPPIGTPLNSQQPPVSQSANMFGGQSSRLPQMNPTGGSTTPGSSCFVQPPPGFGSMPVAGQRSMTPVQQMQPHSQPLPNGNATAAAWSTYGYDTMWNKRR
ncbi:KH domain-containing protein [Aphelenchoides besseyi]|nr:KH domain-containing protein [Aphelenchoides besseyi]